MKRKKVTIEEAKKSGGSKYRDMVQKGLEEYERMPDEKKHQIQVYYGYGKGKTTALMGLAMRALGAGKKVAIVQFDKGYDGVHEHYGERHVIRKLKEIGYNIDMYITGCERMNEDGTFRFKNADVDFDEAKRALSITHELIVNGEQNLLLLDEVLAASAYHLIEEKDVLDIIDLFNKNRRFEMVMTGHKLFDGLEERVGLITEMRKVKHYFDEGIQAREGIEF
ncbi:MAG: cob(I)yrinic acid a,c-diamide adenosyltransferase [Ignavibacteriae bacterium]|nr:MAG: cob(I)yrinic acid a,c-diamide adenosyltransferase [Ignavibacteriota bacterium]